MSEGKRERSLEQVFQDIAGLEATSTHLTERVSGVESAMRAGFETVNATLEQMKRDAKIPIWQITSLVISIVGVGFILVQMMQAGNAATSERLERNINLIQSKIVEHVALPGHPTGMAQIKAFEDRFDRMEVRTVHDLESLETLSKQRHNDGKASLKAWEVNMQREMRDLDARMQGEFGAQISDLRGEVSEIKTDLNSRSGARFNREDYDKYVAPDLLDVRKRLQAIESSRSTSDDRKAMAESVADVRERLALLEATTKRISDEQLARTRRVYGGGGD